MEELLFSDLSVNSRKCILYSIIGLAYRHILYKAEIDCKKSQVGDLNMKIYTEYLLISLAKIHIRYINITIIYLYKLISMFPLVLKLLIHDIKRISDWNLIITYLYKCNLTEPL